MCAPRRTDDPAFAGLRRSPFTAIIALACGAHPPSPDEIETALLHNYCHGLIRALAAAGCRASADRDRVADEMHFINLLTLLAARLSGTTVEQLTASLIPQGPWRSAETVRTLAAAPDVPRLVDALRHIPDAGLLRRVRLPASGPATVEMLETAARHALIIGGLRALRTPASTVTAVSGYLLALEGETRDLCAIAAGRAGGLTQAEIIPLLTMTV
ncbi:MAG: V-type ATPase subunit [Planctomycetota bacterium]